MMATLVTKIDQGIGRHYANQGRKDYFNADGKGKFYLYTDEQGFVDDEDGFMEELNNTAEESLLVDFDEDGFPFPKNKQNKSKEIKTKYIFDLIQKCSGGRDIFTKMQNFEISPKEHQYHKNLHLSQCPTEFIRPIINDETTFNYITIGEQIQCEYLQHLVDNYFRSQIENFNQAKPIKFSVSEWVKTHRHFEELKNRKGEKFKTKIKQAVVGYKTRIGSGLVLPPINIFNDRLEEITDRLCDAIKFVNKIKNAGNFPFQLDVCISFKDAKERVNEENKNDDIKYDDDDDDDDDDEIIGGSEMKQSAPIPIGNICEKLNDCKLKYVTEEYKGFNRIYNRHFIETLKQNKCQNKRFITLIDRTNIDNEKEQIYMYSPPTDSNNIPNDAVCVKYFCNSVVCVIPNKGYKLSPLWDGKSKKKMDINKGKIGVKSRSSTITLSFHVKEEDVVKLYVFVNGQYFRFMPEDLKDILPVFFESNKSNDAFKNGKRIKELIEEIKPCLKDVKFDAFVETYCK